MKNRFRNTSISTKRRDEIVLEGNGEAEKKLGEREARSEMGLCEGVPIILSCSWPMGTIVRYCFLWKM